MNHWLRLASDDIRAQNNKGSISLSRRSVSRSVSSPRLSSRAVRSLARASRSISRKAVVSSSRVLRRRPSKRLLVVDLLANAPLSLPSAPVYSPRFLRVLPRRFLPPAARAAIGVDPLLSSSSSCAPPPPPPPPPSKKRDFDFEPLCCFQSAWCTSISSSSLRVAPRVEACLLFLLLASGSIERDGNTRVYISQSYFGERSFSRVFFFFFFQRHMFKVLHICE